MDELTSPEPYHAPSGPAADLAARALHLKERGDRLEALEALHHAVLLEPGNAHLTALLGDLLLEMGHAEEAMAACRRSIELDPASPAAQVLLGLVHGWEGRRQEAVAALRGALRTAPPSPARADAVLASMHRFGLFEEAVEVFQAESRAAPWDSAALCRLADALAATGRNEEAATCFRRAAAMDPSNLHGRRSLVGLLYTMDRLEECLEEGRALLLDPGVDPGTKEYVAGVVRGAMKDMLRSRRPLPWKQGERDMIPWPPGSPAS